MCQTHPPSIVDRPDSLGFGLSVQTLLICNPFAPSTLTSSCVVTFFVGHSPCSLGVGWGVGGFVPLYGFGVGLGAATPAGVTHSTHSHVMWSTSFVPCFGWPGLSQFPPVLGQGVAGDPALLCRPQLLLGTAGLPHPDPTLVRWGLVVAPAAFYDSSLLA